MTVRPLSESALGNLLRAVEAIKPVSATVDDSYRMGRDYALHGPNDLNYRFHLFATPEHTRAWEQGKFDALLGK